MTSKLMCISFLIIWSTSSTVGVDLSFVSGTTGDPVVLRCIELLVDSGIFTYDHEMIRRLAYVETRNGEQFTPGTGGIWKIKATVFEETKNASSLFAQIQAHFDIAWENVTYSDLDIPIYSALAARIRLALVEESSNDELPSIIEAQFQIWDFIFQGEDAPIDSNDFRTLIDQLPAVLLCSGVYRDIVLLIDSSATIADSDFEKMRTFLKGVVDHFSLSAAFTRIGIVQFASSTEVTLTLSDGVSSSEVDSAIDGMFQLRSSETLIGAGINRALSLFTIDQSSRGPSTGVSRIILILTQTSSGDTVTSSLANAATEADGIIAVGVTSSISSSELETLASGDASTHVFETANYTQLVNISDTVQDRVCEGGGMIALLYPTILILTSGLHTEQVSVSSDQRIEGSLGAGQKMTFAISVQGNGTALTLSASMGSVSAFCSNTARNPSLVVHDFRINAISAVPVLYDFERSANQNVLYCTIADTTSARSTAVSAFVFDVGNPNITDTTTISTPFVQAAQNSSLSDGEIAGIVIACLIFIAGLLIAAVYYWFWRVAPPKGSRILEESAIEFRDLSPSSTVPTTAPVTVEPTAISRSSLQHAPEVPDMIPIPDKPLAPIQLTPPSVHSNIQNGESLNTTNKSVDDPELDPEAEARQQLRKAIDEKDLDAVQSSITDFHKLHLVDVDGDLIRGERLLSVRECLQGLNYAVAQRDVRLLERSIYAARQKNYEPELQAELKKAEVLLQDLKKVESMLLKITNALAANNTKLVEKLVFEMRAMTGFDQATIDRMVDVHRCKEELKVAMTNRDLQLTFDMIEKIEQKGYQKDLPDEVRQAKKMIKELEYLEKVRTDVLNLSQSKVSEIRSYSNPPPGVQEVMGAVYLVLGYPFHELKSWTNIQSLMKKAGKESLKRQILNIDPRKIDIRQTQEAQNLIKPFTIESIQEISIGLALFFVFVSTVIEEVEKLNSGLLSAPSPFFYNLAMNVSNN